MTSTQDSLVDFELNPLDSNPGVLCLIIGEPDPDPELYESTPYLLTRADAEKLHALLGSLLLGDATPDPVPSLRRLQHAANMLDYHEFCDALGWERNEYSKAKFVDFQRMGDMHRFDDSTLRRAITRYEHSV